MNGFSISSLPSTGEIKTRRVPLATTRPRGREEVLPSSSIDSFSPFPFQEIEMMDG